MFDVNNGDPILPVCHVGVRASHVDIACVLQRNCRTGQGFRLREMRDV